VHFASDDMKEVTREGSSDLLIKSPMPGIITKVYKKAGDKVKKG
jgi:biotin carboxyl carrier protein